MPYVVGVLAGLSVTLLVMALYELATTPVKAVARELEEIREVQPSPFRGAARRRRQMGREKIRELIRKLGERAERGGLDRAGWSKRLVQAGFWNSDALRVFLGARVLAGAGLTVAGLGLGVFLGARVLATLIMGAWLGGLGWLIPGFYVLRRRSGRYREIRLALADALDLLVACVEAGMGLNQAMVRVAEEVRHVCTALAEELAMVNLEIRAGTPRADALRNMAERIELDDVESLVSTLVQTERFGTSVGQTLRVQADTLRQKRRQRAEEAAAKTTIKLVFPLVLFVFPALFVVILGPAVIRILQALTKM